ncbi:uncharacterized protein BHQ10_007191 [Talaromyces amestolkiae]|uniref:BRCT domain-containing protein n=1 Tax=Talaromyces amestolkiae TaxID=1196081 RepID=A0A364L5W1_TALAM|nr:uncharacterized protein BHQ10_007191 [Talaromyces amestolkiae]RAO71179.1 hypothetical protein BHQ10_007191 [Talaromyces amestolkiae]
MSNPSPNKKPPHSQPRNHHIFDPWNTSSTGHQRAENPYSRTTEWRDTRREKLARQFRSDHRTAPSSRDNLTGGGGGGGRGEEGEWKWMSAHEATRNELGVADIRRYMGISKPHPQAQQGQHGLLKPEPQAQSEQQRQPTMKEKLAFEPATLPPPSEISRPTEEGRKGIFASLTFYINGSTYPTISDHKLKRLVAEEGGNISLYLARKSVTHVILGAAASSSHGGGSGRKTGGLLSAGKMQKEVLAKTSGFGKGVKYVNVEWCVIPLLAWTS